MLESLQKFVVILVKECQNSRIDELANTESKGKKQASFFHVLPPGLPPEGVAHI